MSLTCSFFRGTRSSDDIFFTLYQSVTLLLVFQLKLVVFFSVVATCFVVFLCMFRRNAVSLIKGARSHIRTIVSKRKVFHCYEVAFESFLWRDPFLGFTSNICLRSLMDSFVFRNMRAHSPFLYHKQAFQRLKVRRKAMMTLSHFSCLKLILLFHPSFTVRSLLGQIKRATCLGRWIEEIRLSVSLHSCPHDLILTSHWMQVVTKVQESKNTSMSPHVYCFIQVGNLQQNL